MMKIDLTHRNVLVTGGSKGIGLACAAAFAAEGAHVAIVSRSRDNLDRALEKLPGVRAIVADLSEAAAAARAIDEAEQMLGALDVLVNSAGAARRYTPAELDAEAWHAAMNAKFFSYIHPTTVLLPRMAARKRGVVINIIGMGGKVANPVHLPGGAANAALMLATAGLAAAYGADGVRVVGISPGSTLTGRVQQGLAAECASPVRRPTTSSRARRSAFRSDATASRRKWRRSRCSSPPTRQATSPAPSSRWTAARRR